MEAKYLVWIIFFIFGVMIYTLLVSSKRADEMEEEINVKGNKVDPSLRAINTYFFDDKNRFSFRKFCDYILCIREGMSINDLAQSIMELDLLLKCSGDLQDRFMSILNYSEAIVGIDYREFDTIKEGIRDEKFKGTYQDLVYIYLSTVFYLKYELTKAKGKFNSYGE